MAANLSNETEFISKEQSGITNISENNVIFLENNELEPSQKLILINVPSEATAKNELEQLLSEWDLFYLQEKFAEAGYDQISDLQSISELELDQMFPTYQEQSHKVRLRRKIVEWRKQNGYNVEVDLLSRSTKSVTSSVNCWLETQHTENLHETTSGNEASRFNLKTFLQTDKGSKIWTNYSSVNPPKLGDLQRKFLIDDILEYHYISNISLCYNDFDKISSDIASTFVGEKKEFYYHRIDKRRPTGKLYNKYRNEAPKLNKIGYFGSLKRIRKTDSPKSKENENNGHDLNENLTEFVKNEEYERDKEWLQCMDVPWSTVEIKFKNTFKGRQQELSNKNFKVHTFYEDWIIYKNPEAFRLIDLEFQLLFPDKDHCLKKKWNYFVDKIIPIITNKIKDKQFIDQLADMSKNEELKYLLILKGLHYLLKPTARLIRRFDKKVWKISIRDSINAFFLELNNVINLKSEIKKKKEVCNEYGIKLQPFIIILEQQEMKFAVCYDEIFYCFKNILDCVSVAFKIHFALNLDYSSECYKVWLFLQHYFFDIHT